MKSERIRLRLRRRGRSLIATTTFPIPRDAKEREIKLRVWGGQLLELALRLREDAEAIQDVIEDAISLDE